ncbi:hypothetical protein GQR58_008596 [Nymphon striatum]|nr:hypothetical protein GQR58_008596 [Nymphon striatum]
MCSSHVSLLRNGKGHLEMSQKMKCTQITSKSPNQKENDEILEDGVHNTNWITRHDYYMYDVQKEEPIDKDQICLLPKFHPFHPSVVKYVNKMYPIPLQEIASSIDIR